MAVIGLLEWRMEIGDEGREGEAGKERVKEDSTSNQTEKWENKCENPRKGG